MKNTASCCPVSRNKYSLILHLFWGKSVSSTIGAVNSLRSSFLPEMLSNPKLRPVQETLNVVMNQNVTLSCHSDSGSPLVTYTLFICGQKVLTLNRTDLTPGLFNLTIKSASDVGEYKCKAESHISRDSKYSNGLNFTLIGMSCCPQPIVFQPCVMQCTCSSRSQGLLCSRYCFGLLRAPAPTAELNFTAVGCYYLRSQ